MFEIYNKKASRGDFDKVRLGISLGQDYHRGDKLKALCEWAAAHYTHVEIMVADTLNRWNSLVSGQTDTTAIYKHWRMAGDVWLAQEQETLDSIPDLIITRWDDYTSHPAFYDMRERVAAAYQNNPSLRAVMDKEINRAMTKRGAPEDVRKYYRGYLIEEAAVNALLCDADNVYPGSFIDIGRYVDLSHNPHFTRVDIRPKALAA